MDSQQDKQKDKNLKDKNKGKKAQLIQQIARHDYEALAKQANLRYVSDEEPGYSRIKWGRGFSYKDPKGQTVKNKKLRDRFKSLVIPPMWSEVWICRYDNGHLQSTGRDEKGRKQYLYHPSWNTVRDKAKYDSLIGFGEVLPTLRTQVEKDLDADELSKANVIAAVIKLLETTLIRVGNSHYAQNNNSFGLSTLRSRHVSETDDGLAFDFVGKSAKEHHIEFQDKRLIEIVQACSDLPGYRIFKYLDANGDKQLVESQDINDYLREHTGHEYSAKDFRTWMASVLAAVYLYEHIDNETLDSPAHHKLREQLVVDMVKHVAEKLGNTPTVCRSSYIHPKVITEFLEGRFYNVYKQGRRGRTRSNQNVDEKALLNFLTVES